jgi:ElaB/YqjD/DUF883 family membrane-anchored ribosome-binding protein
MNTAKLLAPVAAIVPLAFGACERKTPEEEVREERVEAREERREAEEELKEERREFENELRDDLAELDRRWDRFQSRTRAVGYEAKKEAEDKLGEAKREFLKARSEVTRALNKIASAGSAQWKELKGDAEAALKRADDSLDELESDLGETAPRIDRTPESDETVAP